MGNADYSSEDVPMQVKPNVDIEAVIIRADGTIEDLGVVASSADGTASVEMEED